MNAGAEQGFANVGLSVGGTIAQPVDSQIITQSSIYICPTDGVLVLRAIGADGSPGVVHTAGLATGAGAGECVDKVQPVQKGDAIVITAGAGGAAVTRSTAGASNGNDGTDTTITGPNLLNITVKAGKGGKSSATTGVAVLGGDGGQGGFGGDIHRPGGRGGNIAASMTGNNATGGGGVNFGSNLSVTACRGGDLLSTTASVSSSGGGGTNGRGGDLLTGFGQTAGGGSAGDALDGNTPAGKGGRNKYGVRAPLSTTLVNAATDPFGINLLDGNGGDGANSAGPGAGGVGVANAAPPGNGNSFGGTGGVVLATAGTATNSNLWYGAPGGIHLSSGTVTSLKGRDGLVFLRLYAKAK